MPNINFTGATYAASPDAAFGQQLTAGYGVSATNDLMPAAASITVEGRVSMAAIPAANKVFAGQFSVCSVGVNTSGFAFATYGTAATLTTLVGAANICDGTIRHVELVLDLVSGGKLYVGGVLVDSSAITPQQAGIAPVTGPSGTAFDLGSYRSSGSTANDWTGGTIDEVAVWSIARHPTGATFTPPIAPYTGTEQGLRALYHLDGNGTDSKGNPTADGYTVSTGSILSYSAANQISVIANGYLASPVTVTLTHSGGAGSVSGTAVLPAGAPVRQFINFTPTGTVGQRKLTFNNNGGLPNPGPFTVFAKSGGRIAANNANILYSDGNWLVDTNGAKSVNAGAYFKTIFDGYGAELNFDLTNSAGALPTIMYRVDGGSWVWSRVDTCIPVRIESRNASTKHLLEVVIDGVTQLPAGVSRWAAPQAPAIVFKSLSFQGSNALILPARRPYSLVYYGDSIVEGVGTINLAASNAVPDDVICNSSIGGYVIELSERLNAEVCVVGFGSQGVNVGGALGVPPLPQSWNLIWQGQARTFAVQPDFLLICMGTNDGSQNITPNGTTMNNAMLAALPNTKIFWVLPLGVGPRNLQQANIRAIAAAATDPSRCKVIDPTGLFVGGGSSFDATHPLAWVDRASVASGLAALMLTRGNLVTRTLSTTLVDAAGVPRANLTNLTWATFDQTRPGVFDIVTDHGVGATTDANGVLVLAPRTTSAVGAPVWLDVSDSDGTLGQSRAFSGPLALS